jgi:hypothetical protein
MCCVRKVVALLPMMLCPAALFCCQPSTLVGHPMHCWHRPLLAPTSTLSALLAHIKTLLVLHKPCNLVHSNEARARACLSGST